MSPVTAMAVDGLMIVLLACILGGLVRVLRGPTRADRMLAAQLFGTSATALLILMAVATGDRSLLDVALAIAVLALVSVVAFVVTSGREGR